MREISYRSNGRSCACAVRFLAALAVAVHSLAKPAHALEYELDGYQISLDTTLSSSLAVRTSPIDRDFVGVANGGTYKTANIDNGDLNFRQGSLVDATQRIVEELTIKQGSTDLFLRATGFYDPVYDTDVDAFRFPLSRTTVRDIGTDLRLLDAYVFASPKLFGHYFDLRIGNQALNWGESTFIQFGINSITPLDLTALRIPGSELRTAFLPVPAVDLKTGLTAGLTFEGFWQPYWTRTRLEPVGSFFSTNDNILDGGTFLHLDSQYPDTADCVYAATLATNNLFGACVPRSADRHPTGVGEGGFALRGELPFVDNTEFGLYLENYDSRTPFLNFHTGTDRVNGDVLSSVIKYLSLAPNPLGGFLSGSQTYFQNTYTATGSYFADYPSNIQLAGASFNFEGPGGVAMQGEVSHRFNQPIQLASSDLAYAFEAPAICTAAAQGLAVTVPICGAGRNDPVVQATGGVKGFNQDVIGWKRFGVTQWQTTATKLFGSIPSVAVSSITLIGEIGFDYVHDFGHFAGLFNAPYSTDTNSAINPYATVNGGFQLPGQPNTSKLSAKGFATPLSGSYVAVALFDMPNLLPYAIGMRPSFGLQHDFYGTSPTGVNVFVANTASASAGVTFSYLQAWTLGLQYTNHFPVFAGPKFYGLVDRDFFSVTLSYAF